MIKTFRNLAYLGGTDLVRCCQCDSEMLLPSAYGVCPVCGCTNKLETIEQGVEYDIPSWNVPIVSDDALYMEGLDKDGFTVPVLAPNR